MYHLFGLGSAAIFFPVQNGTIVTAPELEISATKTRAELHTGLRSGSKSLPESGDRRSEPRAEALLPVKITLLGQDDDPAPIDGRTVNLSGNGLRLKLTEALPVNAPVRVDLPDGIFLGDVCYCVHEQDVYYVGVVIRHHLADLANLAEVFRLAGF